MLFSRAQVQQLLNNLLELGPRRLMALGLIGFAVLVTVVGGAYYLSRPEFETFLASHTAGSRTVAAETYTGVCSKCHGMNGTGDYGPALQGRAFETADITKLLRTGRTTGLGTMPAVGSNWDQAQITGVIRYLKQTKGAGASGG